jgi:ubiquinol-cytochrome c reductase iron-sulfur subunit
MRERKPPARLNEGAKSPVVLARIRPDELTPADRRENWHVDGMVADSKIRTHVGCPVSLYERTTHHLLVAQSAFTEAVGPSYWEREA